MRPTPAKSSSDLLDNLGRRSPRELTPGAEELQVGQRIMTIFYLASFERDSQMTIVCDGVGKKLLGRASSTYRVAPATGGSRMVLKLAWIPRAAKCSARSTGRPTLAWFDLFMMRKQFLNRKRLAEGPRQERRRWAGGQTPVSAATRPEDAASRSAS